MKKAELETVTLPDGNHLTGYKTEDVFYSWQRGAYHEQPLLEKFFLSRSEKMRCVYDIGANLGNHTVYFATHSKANVFSFEPVPMAFDLLKTNVEQNGLSERVKLFPFALGSEETVTKMQVGGAGKLAHSSITGTDLTTGFGVQDVSVKRLDDMNLPPPDFVKIDVENYELQVLRGMERTLRESSPVLWIEIRDDNKDMPEIYHFLYSLDYIPIDFKHFINVCFVKETSNEKITELCKFFFRLQRAGSERAKSIRACYENRLSWKITAPLRAVRNLFRRQ